MQFQKRNIVVQRLTVVVVMNVSGGHTKGLSTWASVFSCQIVITNSNVNSIARTNNAVANK